jgi:hypothetical protein
MLFSTRRDPLDVGAVGTVAVAQTFETRRGDSPRAPDRPSGQQTAERAASANVIWGNRFVWRRTPYICILGHTLPGCAAGTSPPRDSIFFSGLA